MITLMLTSVNEREASILELAFKQHGFNVNLSKANYRSFIKMLQYRPDILFVEFPKSPADQLHFVKLILMHKQTKNIPVLAYGDQIDICIKQGFLGVGVSHYLERPLKFQKVVAALDAGLKSVSKSLKSPVKQEKKSDREGDVALILDPQTLPTKKIELMVSHSARFLAFPFTVTKVLKLAQDERSGATDLAKVIETDPVISASVLKVSNTVFYASTDKRISSIKNAIVRIGFNETKRLVLTMSVMDLFSSEKKHAGFDRVEFWYHSLATGVIAERLATRMGGVIAEEAFLAGLLHDFGIIILDEFFGEIFAKVLDKTTDEGRLFISAETELLVVNHNDVVKALFEQWKMPSEITEAVVDQYDFHKLTDSLQKPGKRLALCVGVANILAKSLSVGRECDQFVRPIEDVVMQALKMTGGFPKQFFEDIYRDIGMFSQILGLEKRDFTAAVTGIDNAADLTIGYVNFSGNTFVSLHQALEKEGISIISISPTESPSTYDQKCDCILVWAAADTPVDAIKAFSGIVRKPAKTPDSGSNNLRVNASVIVAVDPKSKLIEDLNGKEGFAVIPKSIDLRLVDQAIIESILGKPLVYHVYESDNRA